MKRFLKTSFVICLIPALIFFTFDRPSSHLAYKSLIKPVLRFSFTNIYDTLFTAKDSYIEINLKTQRLYLHFRDGRKFEFLCSSGNSKIVKGVETPEGLFTIQNKAKKIYSTQFDSTLLLHWMGFNYGIGMHALLGSSYYRQLGRVAMSHGCIRLSREDCKRIYESVEVGTPILVHSGFNAIVLAFTDHLERFYIPSSRELKILSQSNLGLLYRGFYIIRNPIKMIISEDNIKHEGIPIGDIRKVPKEQFFIPPLKIDAYLIQDKLKVYSLNDSASIRFEEIMY